LQWGRRVHSAKRKGASETRRPPKELLQWGRRVHSAKRREKLVLNSNCRWASMGSPSSLGEEKRRHETVGLAQFLASMGSPSSLGEEALKLGLPLLERERRFNGVAE